MLNRSSGLVGSRRAPTQPLGRFLAGLLFAVTLSVSGSALADEPPPDPEPKKDGGCGCETTGYPRTYTALSLAFMGLGLVLFRRSLNKPQRKG
ncbi:MAG: hypothetical protein H6718_26800 [Polyangiaceae bacterium]|nr:hypothetical protein [Polyangiaceae bacterium]